MSKAKGFSLIELMIVVVVIAILAAIAYPSYIDSVRKSRRADAMDWLLYTQNLQEKYRAGHSSYGTTFAAIGAPTTTNDGYYTVAITGTPNATSFTIKATPVGDQANDSCSFLQIAVTTTAPRGAKTPTACW